MRIGLIHYYITSAVDVVRKLITNLKQPNASYVVRPCITDDDHEEEDDNGEDEKEEEIIIDDTA